MILWTLFTYEILIVHRPILPLRSRKNYINKVSSVIPVRRQINSIKNSISSRSFRNRLLMVSGADLRSGESFEHSPRARPKACCNYTRRVDGPFNLASSMANSNNLVMAKRTTKLIHRSIQPHTPITSMETINVFTSSWSGDSSLVVRRMRRERRRPWILRSLKKSSIRQVSWRRLG
jgi:hypothetical protein